MKKCLLFIFTALSISAHASFTDSYESLAARSGISSKIDIATCDTILDVDGYSVRVIKDLGKIKQIGLNLFSHELRTKSDKEILNFIESALFAKSRNTEIENSEKLTITSGEITDFKSLTPDSCSNVNFSNSKELIAEWILKGKKVTVHIPLGYDTAKSGSRTEIEQDFITRAKDGKCNRIPLSEINNENLTAYGEDMYIMLGSSYQNKNINRNVYFKNDDLLTPIWTDEYPVESFSDLIIFPSSVSSDPQVEVSVLKHEYGEKESFSVALSKLLAAAEEDGCVPFWGVEKYENEILEGALFLYNQNQGYDHVFKIECNPIEVINNNGIIKARASLFIPTNNVKNLFAPYIKKSEDEKIKYNKK